jgi:hypothetical protein
VWKLFAEYLIFLSLRCWEHCNIKVKVKVKVKLKQSHYRPGVAQGVPGN